MRTVVDLIDPFAAGPAKPIPILRRKYPTGDGMHRCCFIDTRAYNVGCKETADTPLLVVAVALGEVIFWYCRKHARVRRKWLRENVGTVTRIPIALALLREGT